MGGNNRVIIVTDRGGVTIGGGGSGWVCSLIKPISLCSCSFFCDNKINKEIYSIKILNHVIT